MEDQDMQEAPEALEQTENEAEPSAEDIARERGWKPREEWKGDVPSNFMDDPAQYNEVFENSNPRLKQEVEQLRKQLDEFSGFRDQLEQRFKAEKEAEMRALRDELRQTASTGDVAKFDKLMERQEQLQAEAAPQRDEQADFRAWQAENGWYVPGSEEFDPERAALADRIGEHLRARNPSLTGRSFLDAVKAEVDARSAKTPAAPSPVEGSRRVAKAGSPRKISGWNDLPVEKQRDPNINRIVAKMYGGDKDKFAQDWAAQNQG